MKRIALVLGTVLWLSACSSSSPPREAPVGPQQAQRPERPHRPPTSTRDQCGATELAYLVGKPKSQIPVPVDPSSRRVACTTCPVTMDFNPRRVNIFFDSETGVIKEVKCG